MIPLMTHFLADDGEKIHLQISGAGTPLILLHGWTSSHQEWFPFLPELNAHHRVYRWDARGHGDSEWIGRGGYYHFADYVADVAFVDLSQRLFVRTLPAFCLIFGKAAAGATTATNSRPASAMNRSKSSMPLLAP